MHWIFIVLAACSMVLGFERLWRLRDEPVTLADKALLIGLFSLSLIAAAYWSMPFTASFYNIGLAVWHALVGVLIGALEVLVLTLRTEQVRPAAVRAVLWRCGLVTALLLVTWPVGFAHEPPIYHLSALDPRALATLVNLSAFDLATLAMLVHLSAFPAYLVWGLMQVIDLCRQRLPKDIHRRPISTLALLMIAVGCGGFVLVNVVISAHLIIGREVDSVFYFPAPLFLGLCVGGAALLAVGERTHEEIAARYALLRLNPLWARVIELLPDDLHLPAHRLPAPARLQRAYVEISDAICTLRVDTSDQLDLESVVSKLHRGDLSMDPDAPTFSQTLPPRSTRREDLELIHALARAYRRRPASASINVDSRWMVT